MKIRFLKDTNIRDGLPEFSGKIIGVVLAGVELEVDEEILSDRLFNGVATWYRDGRDWYYWGGAVDVFEGAERTPVQDTSVAGRQDAAPHLSPPSFVEGEPVVEDAQDLACMEPLSGEEVSAPVGEAVVPPAEETGKTEEADDVAGLAPALQPVRDAGSERWEERSRAVFDPLRMSWAVRDLQIDRLWRERRLTGEGVYIALLDTGIDARHPDLEGRVMGGRNFCDPGSEDITDEDGRGTRCAGLIAGQGRQGVLGIAPAAGLYVGKVMRNTFDLSFDRLVQGLQWAIQQPVDIIFVGMDLKPSSLTADQRQVLAGIAGSIAERGVLLVAPVGQSSLVKPEDRLPASLEHCLSVGAVDQQHRRYKQSLRSYTLDVAAPGADLLTTASGGGSDPAFSGPDAAAAVAAGALALVAQRMHEVQAEWTIPDLRQAIRETAVSAAGPEGQGRTVDAGFGLLNPWGVLEKIG